MTRGEFEDRISDRLNSLSSNGHIDDDDDDHGKDGHNNDERVFTNQF